MFSHRTLLLLGLVITYSGNTKTFYLHSILTSMLTVKSSSLIHLMLHTPYLPSVYIKCVLVFAHGLIDTVIYLFQGFASPSPAK